MPDDLPSSSSINIVNTNLGNVLREMLDADDLRPGDEPSYEIAKGIYLYHPLGAKMAEAPVTLAQADDREITVPSGPEESVVEAFQEEWNKLQADENILNVKTQSRVYGIASIVMGSQGTPSDRPVNLKDLWQQDIYFNVLDPLNTSGLVTNQDPNSPLFQKHGDLVVQGQRYHRSRSCTVMNEKSIYIAWTSAGFGYVGRSVYQRGFYPLKSFLQTMITDDMVTRKAGVLVAKMQQPGSIVDQVMKGLWPFKRGIIKQAKTDNVISIGIQEAIETLNMVNIDGAYGMARDNIIKNIATATPMPAKLLTQEAYVLGFGEGVEDAKAVAKYIDRLRIEMEPLYNWFDLICMYRAWNPEWYKTIQQKYPNEYGGKAYTQAFYEWKNSFKATWPSLLKEEPSEAVEVDDVKLKAMIAVVQVFAPMLDPANRARVIQWACDNINSHEELFAAAQLELDMDALEDYIEEQQVQQQQMSEMGGDEEGGPKEPAAPRPFGGADSATVASLVEFMKSRPGDRLRQVRERRISKTR